MNWHKKLYVGNTLEGKADDLIRKIGEGEYPTGICLIVIPDRDDRQLEILPARSYERWHKGEELTVVGLAGSHREAVKLVTDMTQAAFESLGTADLKHFFEI